MQDYYAARASEYDDIYRKPERQADLRAIEGWLPGRFTGCTLLELACGTGYWTQFLAPVTKRILAIDAAPETMAIAREREGVRRGQVEFRVGDAYALPALEQPYEAGFAGFWISHVPRARLREFFAGWHAALKPGARVVLLDNRFVPGSSTPVSERDADGNTYQLRPLKDGSSHRVLKNFPTREDMGEALAGLGTELAFHEWPYYWAVEYRVAAR